MPSLTHCSVCLRKVLVGKGPNWEPRFYNHSATCSLRGLPADFTRGQMYREKHRRAAASDGEAG
jgi:hypothetical protein